MVLHFQKVIAAALPSEDTLQARLASLDARDWAEVAEHFSARLPEFGAVIAFPHPSPLASGLSRARGVPTLQATLDPQSGHWTLPDPGPSPLESTIIVTEQLTQGLAELEGLLRAVQHLKVMAVVAGIEHTSAGGRRRLELQGVTVWSAVQLAQTPAGWRLERRRTPR